MRTLEEVLQESDELKKQLDSIVNKLPAQMQMAVIGFMSYMPTVLSRVLNNPLTTIPLDQEMDLLKTLTQEVVPLFGKITALKSEEMKLCKEQEKKEADGSFANPFAELQQKLKN